MKHRAWKTNHYVVISAASYARDLPRDLRFHGAYRSKKRAIAAALRITRRTGRLTGIEASKPIVHLRWGRR